MPPKAKFSEDEIIAAALQIVRSDGIMALTARALGAELGSSARPIFTVFRNMEEVHQAVKEAAKKVYTEYIDRGLTQTPAFKGVGTQYIVFSINEQKLFQLLFMSEQENVPDLTGVLQLIDENYERILQSIQDAYGLYGEPANNLYQHMWIYCHGIATLCATKMCRFTGAQLSEMMTEVFSGLIRKMKEGTGND